MSKEDEPRALDPRLAQARRDFPHYYVLASAEEAALMDALVLAHHALLENIRIPRQFLSPNLRPDVEKTTDAIEGLYTVLRASVQGGGAFSQVNDAEQARMERTLFSVEAPGHDS